MGSAIKGKDLKMKQLRIAFYFSIILFTLAGCFDKTNEEASMNNNAEENTTDVNKSGESDDDGQETIYDDSDHTAPENSEPKEENKDALSAYSNEQIEYARIWLQLGSNQELDEIHVQRILAGEPLNPDDETSASYPEDVIQLSGTRLVDGSVTQSGNGDGTINVYKVPLRWDGVYPAGEEFYIEMIENTELVAVDIGDEEKIIALINLKWRSS